MKHATAISGFIAVMMAAGCGGDGGGDGDTGTDTLVDTGADTTLPPDTSTDTAADPDVSEDTTPDISPDTGTDPEPDGPTVDFPTHFHRYVVDDANTGPAYASVGDVTGDGQLDVVVSYFGGMTMQGKVLLHQWSGDLTTWTTTEIVPVSEGFKFPNQVDLADLDGDTDLDLILPAGFLACTMGGLGSPCGALAWYEQTSGGWVRHDVVAQGSALFYHHVELADLDGDGRDDMITVGEEQGAMFPPSPDRAVVQMFRGVDGADLFSTTPTDLGEGLGSIPSLIDLDGDTDLDIASGEYFHEDAASFAWFEQVDAPTSGTPGVWTRHVICDDVGPAIMLDFVPDLYGDGVTRALGSNHTNVSSDGIESAVYAFFIPTDPTGTWPRAMISEGIVSVPGTAMAPMAAPGIFGWGDIDGDGDVDVAVSGDGDKRFIILEQTEPGYFTTHTIEEPYGQAGGMQVVDLDGDGHMEVVTTSYEENLVVVFEWMGP